MEKVILEAISRYMRDKRVTGNSHYKFIWDKSCLTNLTDFYDERVGTRGPTVDVTYLGFSKVFT